MLLRMHSPEVRDRQTPQRTMTYVGLFVALFSGFLLLRHATRVGTKQLHTPMELTATLLAFMVGIVSLVRFYTKTNNTFLCIGTGF